MQSTSVQTAPHRANGAETKTSETNPGLGGTRSVTGENHAGQGEDQSPRATKRSQAMSIKLHRINDLYNMGSPEGRRTGRLRTDRATGAYTSAEKLRNELKT